MKIVFCTNSICSLGGIEVITIVKANALAQIPDNQVWIVVPDHDGSPILPLKNVNLVNLAIHFYENDCKGKIHATIDMMKKRHLYRQRCKEALSNIQPDVIISTGLMERNFLPHIHISSHPVFIREIHHAIHNYFREATGWKDKILGWLRVQIDFKKNIKAYDKIVVLTPEGKSGAWEHWDKVAVIPNPLTDNTKYPPSAGNAKVAVAAGRLSYIKNYGSLVRVWAKVCERHPDWVLQIWGEGAEHQLLYQLIADLGMEEHIQLMGYTNELIQQMSHASLHLVSSRSEGFSLTTLEAASVGLPTVGYNCPGGFRYLVKDGKTGILVPLDDENTFAEQICRLIEHPEKRKAMGQAALKEVENYRIEHIVRQWMDLFTELLKKKHENHQ